MSLQTGQLGRAAWRSIRAPRIQACVFIATLSRLVIGFEGNAYAQSATPKRHAHEVFVTACRELLHCDMIARERLLNSACATGRAHAAKGDKASFSGACAANNGS
jgi:hypothetical protein